MSITVRDCLKLPSLSLGKVIAGHKGLDSIVTAVSVLEFDDEVDTIMITPNELLISAFYSMRGDVERQCECIRRARINGDVGLVLFYSEMILGSVDPKLIETANLLNFPIILMPERDMGLKYSDVISDVMEKIFYDRRVNHSFVSSTLERLSQTPESMRNLALALRYASDYAKASFFLCSERDEIILSSFWPGTNSSDRESVKKSLIQTGEEGISVLKNEKGTSFFRMPFTGHKQEKLVLCAVSHNEILNPEIMSQVAEILSLFTALWNYNLNLSTRESVIAALFEGNEELTAYICEKNGLDRSQYNRMRIVKIEEELPESNLKQILAQLKVFFAEHKKTVLADFIGRQIVMLYHGEKQPKDNLIESELTEYLEQLESVMVNAVYETENIFEKVTGFLHEFIKVQEEVHRIYPLRRTFRADDIRYVMQVLKVRDSFEEQKIYYTSVLQPILQDGEPELTETLCCYLLDAGAELKTASELLYVHRNTVLYRLNKIKSLLGFDIAKMPQAYDVYMAVSLYRISK